MAMKLSTTLRHLDKIPNPLNKHLLREFHEYLKLVDTSETYQNQMLKELISYAKFLGKNVTFNDIQSREEILKFLDTKIVVKNIF